MKEFVAMEKKICPICGKEYETGAILMDRRLRKSFESRYVITGYGECDDCKKRLDDGYIALIVIKNAETEGRSRLKMEDANRTGEILFLKAEFAKHIFVGIQFSEDHEIAVQLPRMAFISEEGCVKLRQQVELQQNKNESKDAIK